jgi:hypothetical protein
MTKAERENLTRELAIIGGADDSPQGRTVSVMPNLRTETETAATADEPELPFNPSDMTQTQT